MLARASLLVALTMLIAGCAAAESSIPASTESSQAPSASVTADLGSIEGQVLSEDQLPITGVEVGITGAAPLTTKTDDAGRFVFNALAGGTYKVIAQKLGYESSARSVDVKPGEVSTVTISLVAIEVLDETLRVLTIYDGLVQCSLSIFTPINPCGGVTGDDKDSWIFEIDRTKPFKGAVFELAWKPTGPASIGESMELEVCDDLSREYLCTFGGTTSAHYYWASGKSPQTIRLDDKQLPKTSEKWLTGAGAAFEEPPLVQQKFSIYMTLCYNGECGEEYSALPPPQ